MLTKKIIILICILTTLSIIFLGLVNLPLSAQKSPVSAPSQDKKFPEGGWVKYQVKRFRRSGVALKQTWSSEFKITVLKKTVEKKKQQTWLELVANEGRDTQKIISFPVNDQGEPIPDRLIIKHHLLPAAEINLLLWADKTKRTPSQIFNDFTGKLLIIPVNSTHQNETKADSDLPVPIAIGTPAEKISLTVNKQKFDFNCEKFNVNSADQKRLEKRWYLRPDEPVLIPLSGLLKANISEGDEQTQIVLTDYDTKGGASLITEKPTALDFSEAK